MSRSAPAKVTPPDFRQGLAQGVARNDRLGVALTEAVNLLRWSCADDWQHLVAGAGGFWLAIGYVIAGLLAFVLIVTIPFGIASFRLASFVLWPFGRTTTWRRDAGQ